MKSRTQLNVTFGMLALVSAFAIASTQPTPKAFGQDASPTPVAQGQAMDEDGIAGVPPTTEQPAVVDTVDKGQVAVPPAEVITKTEDPADVSNETFFESVANAFGQAKGATILGIVLIVVQLLIRLLKTPMFQGIAGGFKFWDDQAKLLTVSFLTVVSTLVGLVSQGMGWGAAAVSGVTLSAITVFIHQLFLKFIKKPAQKVA